jgi:hypothetical protein
MSMNKATAVVTTAGQRKAALMMTTLSKGDRRRILSRLPRTAADPIRRLIAELDAMPWPVAELAQELLADEMRGLTASTSLELEQIVALSKHLPPVWFARALAAWPGIDRNFCISLLDPAFAEVVKRALVQMTPLSPKAADAIKAEVVELLAKREAA